MLLYLNNTLMLKKRANEEKESLGKVVKNYGLNPENVFGIEAPPVAAPPAAAPAAGATQRNVKVDY